MKRIMIAVDFSDQTDRIMDTGLGIAEKFGAEVILLHTEEPEASVVNSNVMGPYGGMAGFGVDMTTAQEIISNQITKDKAVLETLKERALLKGLKVKTEVFIGNELFGIVDECKEYHPDLLVMGLHKKSFFSRLLGENPELALVKIAPCPLLLIPVSS